MAANEKFGVREVVDITFKAKADMQIGNTQFEKGEPVFMFDSAKTSTLESTTTTVYAQGGRGNPRLIAWEGDKTVTFTFEEALISAQSFAMLSGANLIENSRVAMHQQKRVEVVQREVQLADKTAATVAVLDLTDLIPENGQVISAADSTLVDGTGKFLYEGRGNIYVMELDADGQITRRFKVNQSGALKTQPSVPSLSVIAKSREGEPAQMKVTETFQLVSAIAGSTDTEAITGNNGLDAGKIYMVDYYVLQPGSSMTVTAGKFAGTYLIEANTLFRRQADGRDYPAQFTIPNGKISSAFTFTMAPTGDPSTFPFTVDAFPDYLPFNRKCKALFALEIADAPVEESDC